MVSRMRVALVIVLLLNVPMAAAQSLSIGLCTGLVRWWPFDGSLLDEGPNGHHGAAAGTQVPSYGDGTHGLAARFDGIDDRVRVPTLPNCAFGTGFSSAFWLRLDDARSSSILRKRSGCNFSHGFDLDSSDTQPPRHEFVMTVPGQMFIAIVYVNGDAGMARTIGALDLSSPTAAFAIGDSPCLGDEGGERLNGRIDELRVYNGALSIDEIEALAASADVVSRGRMTDTPFNATLGGQVLLAADVAGLQTGATCTAHMGYAVAIVGHVPVGADGRVEGVVTLPETVQPENPAIVAFCCSSPAAVPDRRSNSMTTTSCNVMSIYVAVCRWISCRR